ncbi:MAG TPA: glycoside hydrolase family 3 N-terminal domain-containing protein [Terriglobales bacterium]|nr:glycoside hydrolase family 3 N-terminal domain-containing protein [Terriglobales bacterium]
MLSRLTAVLLLFASLCAAEDKFQRPGPVQLTMDGNKWAEKTLKRLSLEQKVGQLFMVRALTRFYNTADPDYARLRDQIQRYHLGAVLLTIPSDGPVVYKSQPYEAAMFTNHLQADAELPLLVAADFERGLSMRFYGTTNFPHPMAFAATGKREYAAAMARVVGQEARAIGVQWNLFPIADVNSAPDNPIINTRSFGEDPAQVGELDAAYIDAARDAGILTTAKHFPGHGDVSTDTHLGVGQVTGSREHLEHIELAPFRAAIDAGVDAVMTAHVTVPALDPDPNRVATVSRAITTGLLKDQLGFKGLVVTDAMDMGGVTRLFSGQPGRAAVEALKAGNDMVLLPADLEAAFNAVVAAVRNGEIPEAQIDDSVLKVLRAKAALDLHKTRQVDIHALASTVAQPASMALGQQVADEAVTLVRENGQVLPIKKNGTHPALPAYQQGGEAGSRVLAVFFSDSTRDEGDSRFEPELKSRVPDARLIYVDPRTAAGLSATVLEAAQQARTVIVGIVSFPSAGRMIRVQGKLTNSVAMGDAPAALLQRLLERAGAKTVVVSLGSPYVASGFSGVENYLCTFSSTTVSETAAVKALFGEIPIHGRLPVSVPGIAARGAGLDRPPLVSRNGGVRHVER